MYNEIRMNGSACNNVVVAPPVKCLCYFLYTGFERKRRASVGCIFLYINEWNDLDFPVARVIGDRWHNQSLVEMNLFHRWTPRSCLRFNQAGDPIAYEKPIVEQVKIASKNRNIQIGYPKLVLIRAPGYV